MSLHSRSPFVINYENTTLYMTDLYHVFVVQYSTSQSYLYVYINATLVCHDLDLWRKATRRHRDHTAGTHETLSILTALDRPGVSDEKAGQELPIIQCHQKLPDGRCGLASGEKARTLSCGLQSRMQLKSTKSGKTNKT
jgi:hypothetical protein